MERLVAGVGLVLAVGAMYFGVALLRETQVEGKSLAQAREVATVVGIFMMLLFSGAIVVGEIVDRKSGSGTGATESTGPDDSAHGPVGHGEDLQ
jgi:hypothetical protein